MNGRVYDPRIARFLSADPAVQQETNLQNYNRYSYVLNNPLNATDPTGYCWQLIANAALGYLSGQSTSQILTVASASAVGFSDQMTFEFGGSFSFNQQTMTSDRSSNSESFWASGAGENQHVLLTSDESQYAKDGMLKEYWNSRHDRGDPWAAAGLAMWGPEHEVVTDAHRDMAKVLQGRLIYEGIVSGNLSNYANIDEINSFMTDIGVAVMQGHALEVQRDFTEQLGDRYGVIDKYQSAMFHHSVFKSKGLRPFVYGGTPFGIGDYVPFVSAQAWLSYKFASLRNHGLRLHTGFRLNSWYAHMCFGQGYISNEDTHHKPAGK